MYTRLGITQYTNNHSLDRQPRWGIMRRPQRKGNQLTRLTGKQIGDLRVLQKVPQKKGRPKWRCICVCGSRITVAHQRLIHKVMPKTHCGCKAKGAPTLYKVEYHAWWDAKQRCHDENHPGYPVYGAKGIRMEPAWQRSFEAFLEFIGPRPTKYHSLDRINAHGHYAPGNVRWATVKEQARNKKDTKWVNHPTTGAPIKAAELAEEWGVSYQAMRNRMIDMGEW